MTKSTSYRLGLDIGTNSIGFALVKLRTDAKGNSIPYTVLHMGSRIFSDGREAKTGASLAVDRRTARGMRRRRDRLVRRKQQLIEMFIATGLMPKNKDERKKLELLDPYALRTQGLDEKLTPYELGRALFHLNQRRGFQSNRKQATKDQEAGAISEAGKKLQELLEDQKYRTYGEFLYHHPVKRVRNTAHEANKTLYEFYPLRDILKAEYDALLEAQRTYHPELLTPPTIQEMKDVLFYQRPLRPVQKGRCSLLPQEERAYAALPSSQRFRILKEVNNLTILDKLWRRNRDDLTDEQREKVIAELYKRKTAVSFDALRKLLKLDSATVFNLESENRRNLDVADTYIKLSRPECFGSAWNNLTLLQQDEIVEKLLDDTLEDAKLSEWLKEQFHLGDANIQAIMDAPLQDGTMKFSTKAITQIIPHLEEGKNEYEAITACGWQYANRYTGEIVDALPYYGEILESHVAFGTGKEEDSKEKRYGKIANPTVHIVLNQLRRLVNELIATHGHPQEIAIEFSRDLKLNKKEKARREKEIRDNTKANERYDAQIIAAGLKTGSNREYRLRCKLHEQQDGQCAYSGKAMSIAELLSDTVEIDHILPFSRTFDDSVANKVVVFRDMNRMKGNQSPHEAFQHQDYDALLARINNLPGSKKWRFLPDAMKRFEEQRDNGDEGWLARQLTDTSYMARMAREYLRYIVGDRVKGFSAVDTYPGGVTAKLRRGWGMNSLLPNDPDGAEKNRTDHRHHAIDALVIACANRSLLQQISKASANNEALGEEWYKNLSEKAPPYAQFNRTELQKIVDNIIISHKPDHGTPGKGDSGGTTSRLHEDTFYGLAKVQGDTADDKLRLVIRKPLTSLSEKDITKISDPDIRRRLAYAVDDRPDGEKTEETIRRFGEENQIRRIRLFEEKGRKAMKVIHDKQGKPYRYVATGGNHHLDIFCPIKDTKTADGKKYKAGKWYAETISHFDANQKGFEPQWRKDHPTAKLVMRLHINDMVAYEENEKREIRRIKKIDGATDRAYLVSHLVAVEQADKLSWAASANKLQEKNARKIAVTPAGKVFDPGCAPMPKPFRKKEDKAA